MNEICRSDEIHALHSSWLPKSGAAVLPAVVGCGREGGRRQRRQLRRNL